MTEEIAIAIIEQGIDVDFIEEALRNPDGSRPYMFTNIRTGQRINFISFDELVFEANRVLDRVPVSEAYLLREDLFIRGFLDEPHTEYRRPFTYLPAGTILVIYTYRRGSKWNALYDLEVRTNYFGTPSIGSLARYRMVKIR